MRTERDINTPLLNAKTQSYLIMNKQINGHISRSPFLPGE